MRAFALLVAASVRHFVSLHPHSGQATPPMYGDYEAQRHWMEVTWQLPVGDWYRNTTDNDLQCGSLSCGFSGRRRARAFPGVLTRGRAARRYWGLDYPPLTAYVSLACGALSSAFDPASMALHTSRGYETAAHKAYMRMTVRWAFPRAVSRVSARVDTPAGRRRPPQVLALDIAVFFTACLSLANVLEGAERTRTAEDASARQRRMLRRVVLALAAPAPILVDHGHFQYNSVSLGLALHAVAAIARGHEVLGSVLFCAALNFKQMCLYFAPGIFFHLLARCMRRVHRRRGARASWLAPLLHVAKLGVAVIASFLVLWAPFCVRAAEGVGCVQSLGHVLHRQFPFERGIFEDKVANFWCVMCPRGGLSRVEANVVVCSVKVRALRRRTCAHVDITFDARAHGARLDSRCDCARGHDQPVYHRRTPFGRACRGGGRGARTASRALELSVGVLLVLVSSSREIRVIAARAAAIPRRFDHVGLVAAARGLDTASIRRVARRSGCFLDVASPHAGWARARLRCLPRFACSSLGALRRGQSARRAPDTTRHRVLRVCRSDHLWSGRPARRVASGATTLPLARLVSITDRPVLR